MFSLINAKVRITDKRMKMALLNTRSIFLKRVHIDHKAKDCLSALSLIQKDEPLESFLAVRLLGQIPDQSQLYKDLFRTINSQLKESGLEIRDIGSGIVLLPKGLL